MKQIIITLAAIFSLTVAQSQNKTLAEKLGYKSTDKLLIVNCDDVGMCHAANIAYIEGQENGIITSGTVMVPCPWFSEIADYASKNPNLDLGVHLTHTAEWKYYRWGTVADAGKVPGLLDEQGFMWGEVADVYKNGTPDEALIEARAQIQKAIDAGIPINHLDSHMGTLQENPEFFKVYLQLAVEFNLPLRMASQSTLDAFGHSGIREMVAEKGIVCPDYFIYEEMANYKDVKPFWTNIVKNMKPGVSEIYIHASKPGEEVKSITYSWKTRGKEYELFVNDKEFAEFLKKENVFLIGYKPLFELQRKK
jgi:hypothetical protein